MYINQQKLTEKALFDYYMVSSAWDEYIYSTFPYYLDKCSFNAMVDSAIVLDRLVNRLLNKIIEEKSFSCIAIDDFECKKEIFGLTLDLPPFFWARYDAFEREEGGIFFSEFNYDKPCGQREIAMSDMMNPHNNPNKNFSVKFAEGFRSIWNSFSGGDRAPLVAILVDPGHYEELHLAYLYIDLLKPLNYNFIVIGGNNLYVENGYAAAFGQKIDIILRQFPTEFSSEINQFKDIIKIYNDGKVLILNDPRSVIIQAKSLFATLWELAEHDSDFLSDIEKNVIKKTLPYTVLFDANMAEELRAYKDKYVIKAALGRYSEEVYIGKMHTDAEWNETIEYVVNSEKIHVVQHYCQTKKQRVLRYNGNCYEEVDAYGNFGIYMVNGDFSGICVRFSEDFLSLDESVWISSVGVRDRALNICKYVGQDSELKWDEINDYAAFEHGYTGGYTGWYKSFSLDYLMLQRDVYEELVKATERITVIFKKVRDYVLKNIDVIGPVLGISDNLLELIKVQCTDMFTFIGRYDWVMDSVGNLKLLELNAETPAGMMESLIINPAVKEKLNIEAQDPNKNMDQLICTGFNNIVKDYKENNSIKNIGFVSSTFGEDWYNTTVILEQLNKLPYDFKLGEISGIKADGGKIKLYGSELDEIFRYYPLDWFDKDEYYNGVISAMKYKTLSINPPSTIISQSKAFFALIYELRKNNFFDKEECIIIDKYIPRTYLSYSKVFNGIFCAKPYFEREGKNVAFSFKQPFLSREIKDYIYQEWIDIQSISMDIHTVQGSSKEIVYPVMGTYIVGEQFGGIYTRAGSSITNKWVVFLPAYVEKSGRS
jgi:glutathionylspermidine synthase